MATYKYMCTSGSRTQPNVLTVIVPCPPCILEGYHYLSPGILLPHSEYQTDRWLKTYLQTLKILVPCLFIHQPLNVCTMCIVPVDPWSSVMIVDNLLTYGLVLWPSDQSKNILLWICFWPSHWSWLVLTWVEDKCGLQQLWRWSLLQFNLMRVEIRELRPEVVAEGDEVLVHYRSRTNVTRVIF